VNIKCVEEACSYGMVELLPSMFGQKIKATTKSIENLLQHHANKPKSYTKNGKNQSHDIIIHQMNILLKYGAEPGQACLLNACKIKDKSVIEKIISYKIVPNKKCFDALIGEKYHYYGRHVQKAKDADLIAELIDLLITAGYKLTLKDVTNALENGYYVNDIKRFDFKIDQKFVDKCYETGYFPYNNLDVKPSLDCLRAEFRKSGNIKTIRQLVKQGLEPDIDCLRDACKIRVNQANIKFLLEDKNIKPDLECIKNLANAIGNNQMRTLLSHYNPADDKTVVTPVANSDDKDSDEEDKDDDSEEKPKKAVKAVAKKRVVKRAVTKKPIEPVAKPKPIIPVDDDSISEEESAPVNKI
jgi:ribosomal protein L12E/L44/L45/RPP1/RPP2